MGKEPEQTFFFQTRYVDDQQAREYILKIASHQRNANQNHNKT